MKKLLYFTADWCGPCTYIKPQMRELSSQIPITFIDVDTSKSTTDHYHVRNIPCVILINAFGDERGRLVGTNVTKDSVINLYNR
jgi:thiol-disulfide isomerase/thioredoxin